MKGQVSCLPEEQCGGSFGWGLGLWFLGTQPAEPCPRGPRPALGRPYPPGPGRGAGLGGPWTPQIGPPGPGPGGPETPQIRALEGPQNPGFGGFRAPRSPDLGHFGPLPLYKDIYEGSKLALARVHTQKEAYLTAKWTPFLAPRRGALFGAPRAQNRAIFWAVFRAVFQKNPKNAFF